MVRARVGSHEHSYARGYSDEEGVAKHVETSAGIPSGAVSPLTLQDDSAAWGQNPG